MVRTLARELLSMIVPPLCAACREPEFSGAALCPDCSANLVCLPETRCRRCGAAVGAACDRCLECAGRPLAFDCAWAPFAYEGACKETVAALKSRAMTSVVGLMAAEIEARAPSHLLDGVLVPVPTHARRRRRHGFNQAEAIARALGRRTGLPVRNLLVRNGRATPQVGLVREARLANARGSVSARAKVRPPARAVLVDDVYTTGATLDACARALHDAGTPAVVAVTFARAVRA